MNKISKPFAISCIAASFLIAPMANADDRNPDNNWDGWYGGIGLGVSMGSAQPDSELLYSGDYFSDSGSDSDSGQLDPLLQNDIDSSDFAGSLLFGYDHRSDNLILGIEADLTISQFSETNSYGPTAFDTMSSADFTIATEVESDYQFSLRPKIGYANDNFQIYLSAGPSISRFTAKNEYSDTFSGGSYSYTSEETVIGLSSSIAASYMLGNDWALRGEYIYSYFSDIYDGSIDVQSDGDDDIDYGADFESHTVRIAIVKYF